MSGRAIAILAALLAAGPAAAKPRREVLHRAEQSYLDGVVYFENGDWDKALASWTQCWRSAPRGTDESEECRVGLEKLGEAPASPPVRSPRAERRAEQAYLEGVVYYEKGEYDMAAAAWKRGATLAPDGDAGADCRAGLERLDKLYGVTPAP